MSEIRIDEQTAKRLIAHRLRKAEANDLARTIVTGLLLATPTEGRPALKEWKLVPPFPTEQITVEILQSKNRCCTSNDFDGNAVHRLWKLIYDRGIELWRHSMTDHA
jgi:hypothetical protein